MAGPMNIMSGRSRALVRHSAVMIVTAAVLTATSGCAAAARILFAVDTLATVNEIMDSPVGGAPDLTSSTSTSAVIGEAVVDGTGGSGLWIRQEPGGRGITVLDEGRVVDWSCRRDGPRASGPRGTTTHWALVRSVDGNTGFASGAYLLGPSDVATLPPCP